MITFMGQASSAEAPREKGTVIGGRYLVERLLGQGGMGSVYVAIDTGSLRRVALKQLSREASPKTMALFEREYHTLAGLRHPCIVETYEYGSDEGSAFYTMELVQGNDLSKQAPMPWREACACLRDVASILGLLHARDLLHRDLSPRNLLRQPNGRLKLIDFGALAPFGVSSEVVGTPPFMAPESLRGERLDQRSDLFALGALGYWLLTGVHAFPARTLMELPQLWERTPTPPSSILMLLRNPQLEPCPPELDALIAGLLRRVPAERPESTAELIEQLNSIADLEPESDALAAQGYLESKAFVGRARERETMAELLEQLKQGIGQALLLEGDPGLGRTRLLDELSLMARLDGVALAKVSRTHGDRAFGTVHLLALQLAGALPTETREAAAPHPELAILSDELRSKLGLPDVLPSPELSPEESAQMRLSLCALFERVSQQRPIALFVDDVHQIDDESLLVLTALAQSATQMPLLLIASAGRGVSEPTSPTLDRLRRIARRVRLVPLTRSETLALLHSVFGETRYLERIAERLHRASEGNPAHCLELAEHLVRKGIARYEEGRWVLPPDLTAEHLPHTRGAARTSQLDRLSRQTRQVARVLSVGHEGALTVPSCLALTGVDAKELILALAELQRLGVLRESERGYRFAHEEVRSALYGELEPEQQRQAHLALARAMLSTAPSEPRERLQASVHFLRGGDPTEGMRLLRSVRAHYAAGDLSTLDTITPLLEEVLSLLSERGYDAYAAILPLSLLAVSSYFVDRRYAERYGPAAIRSFEELLRLDLARRLRGFLGRKLALLIALSVAGVAFYRRRAYAPSLFEAVKLMLTTSSALASAATVCFDVKRTLSYAEAIEPLTALGDDHAASLLHRFIVALAHRSDDRRAESIARLETLLARLESDVPIRQLPERLKRNYIAGCYASLGMAECARDGRQALACADRLDTFGPRFAMSAEMVRTTYYASQGQTRLAEEHRKKAELHTAQAGTAWHVELWICANSVLSALRTHSAPLMKRALHELTRLSGEVASLRYLERQARAAYLILRGRHAQALPLLDTDEEPLGPPGWTRTRALLARSLNGIGQHARARSVCVDALGRLGVEDLTFVALHLPLQIELALAEAELGQHDLAAKQLDALLARHAPNESPLTLGALHEARAKVALAASDYATSRAHLEQMSTCYRQTGTHSLLELVERLTRQLERAERPSGLVTSTPEEISQLMTRLKLMLTQTSTVLTERATEALRAALEVSNADAGFLVVRGGGRSAMAHLGTEPDPELLAWAEQNMRSIEDEGEATVLTDTLSSIYESNRKSVGHMNYCLAPLYGKRDGEVVALGALVLGFDNRVAELPNAEVLHAVAEHLHSSSSAAND